jgi:hypothetical protein
MSLGVFWILHHIAGNPVSCTHKPHCCLKLLSGQNQHQLLIVNNWSSVLRCLTGFELCCSLDILLLNLLEHEGGVVIYPLSFWLMPAANCECRLQGEMRARNLQFKKVGRDMVVHSSRWESLDFLLTFLESDDLWSANGVAIFTHMFCKRNTASLNCNFCQQNLTTSVLWETGIRGQFYLWHFTINWS